VTTRERRTVFGEVADDYDAVRAGYASEIPDTVAAYLGRTPRRLVEVGAGTGKATDAFARLGAPIDCVEPDEAMAAILSGRYRGDDRVTVHIGRFEDWQPVHPDVDVLYCAQAWHWIDPEVRYRRAHDVLAPGGVLALTGHRYHVADDTVRAALDEVYRREVPNPEPDRRTPVGAEEQSSIPESPMWTDRRVYRFERTETYPTGDFLRLLTTFSENRLLPPDRLAAALDGAAAVADAHGGGIGYRIETILDLARRVP
jgi:SAM-dependent methyltransferase